ncbi:translation initiation factor IF-2 [Nannizzia gypsea CBS 118893]|uniref:Translation initiation factor IF-2, mitochondrial n=1 Tax=Arthroderma gypseum (strain ATCC MYA-4604 / CBS 118893) TaxID=535722 RepID=E5R0Z9_ARTGP|nr:translation initiation factor IF-2 [Nannizzia gypsea CBS 118893]EFQ97603.1 translation initiation factor IF-2 [Nannizzia gypsea CBS 118893]
MRRHSILKGIRCQYCCSPRRFHLEHISNHELPGQQIRQLSSSSNSVNGPDNNNDKNKNQASGSTFGRGWGAPAFGGQVSCTAAELKQREALLASQVAQKPSAPAGGSATQNVNRAREQRATWVCAQCQKANPVKLVSCPDCNWRPSQAYLTSSKSRPAQLKPSTSKPSSDGVQVSSDTRNQKQSKFTITKSWASEQSLYRSARGRQQPPHASQSSRDSRFGTPSASSRASGSTDTEKPWQESGFRSISRKPPSALDSQKQHSSASASWQLSGFRSLPPQPEQVRSSDIVPESETPVRSKPPRDELDTEKYTNERNTGRQPPRAVREKGRDFTTRYEDADEEVSFKPRKQKGRRSAANDDLDEPQMRPNRRNANRGRDLDREVEYEVGRPKRKDKKDRKKAAQRVQEQSGPTPIVLPDFISVGNLADAINVRRPQFIKSLQSLGFDDVTNDHVLDSETAGLIVTEFNFEPVAETNDIDLVAAPRPEDTSNLPPRPPVVTIMGHVDHGKTTLLDYLRKSSVVATEHGGITQHIGAFSVTMPSGKQITFLDTPGHAAFLEMRKRGADVTDIVILVVAADDSVKPQTIEAIKHAKGADVPIIVAINKIDKDDVNIDRVKQDLARHNVSVEDYGGDVQAIGVSGKTGQGMLKLEEAVITLSEMLDLRADKECNFEGWIIEASTKRGGRAATVLVRQGTLRPGDIIVAGTSWAKIRTLQALPGISRGRSMVGEISRLLDSKYSKLQMSSVQRTLLLSELKKEDVQRLGGDVEAINQTRRETRERRQLQAALEESGEVSTDSAEKSGPQPIPFIVKADVSGSAEAIVNALSAVGNNEVFARILHFNVGKIGESDIRHASAANADVISFNQSVDPEIMKLAVAEGVDVLNHNIIYELIDDVKMRLSEHLPPTVTQRVSGEAEIGEVFEIKLKGKKTTSVAGCKVGNGVIHRSHNVRVLRGKNVIYDGTLSSLKNVKKDVTEMRKGTECGMAFEGWTDFAVGDEIQTYEVVREKRYLE